MFIPRKIFIPKDLLEVTFSIGCSPNLMCSGFTRLVILCFEAIHIYSVLVTWILNLLAINHDFTISNFALTEVCISSKQDPVTDMQCYPHTFFLLIVLDSKEDRWYIKEIATDLKSIRRGTPHVIVPPSDNTPFTEHLFWQAVKYEWNHDRESWLNP